MKRQLTASPLASPVLKQPCKTRRDTEPEDDLETGDEDSGELAQPLSLADLKTETYDFTSITATTCTSYFTNLGIDDVESKLLPLHSTAATSAYNFHPPACSTMLSSQRVPTTTAGIQLMTTQGPSCVDSGVAASSEFNATSGVSLTNELGITKSSSNSQLSNTNKDEQSKSDSNAEASDSGSQKQTAKFTSLGGQSTVISKCKHPELPTIQEGMMDVQARTTPPYRAPSTPSEVDSGLASPLEGIQALNGLRHVSDPLRADCRSVTPHHGLSPQLKCTPDPLGSKLPSSKPSSLLGVHCNTAGYGTFTSLHTTPSRYSATTSTTAMGLGSGHTLTHQGKFTSKAIFPRSVLPSRLKLHTPLTPTLSLPGSTSYNSSTTTNSRANANIRLTPTRYSGVRHRSSFTRLTEEVLRKKEMLKSKLQFNSKSLRWQHIL